MHTNMTADLNKVRVQRFMCFMCVGDNAVCYISTLQVMVVHIQESKFTKTK